MKWISYPLLFLVVILVPTSLAALFADIPNVFPFEPKWWTVISALTGYTTGYVLLYLFARAMNRSFKQVVYSKRMRTSYLMTSAIVGIFIFFVLSGSLVLLFDGQLLNQALLIFFIGLPWLSVQMLLLFFFVRTESLFK